MCEQQTGGGQYKAKKISPVKQVLGQATTFVNNLIRPSSLAVQVNNLRTTTQQKRGNRTNSGESDLKHEKKKQVLAKEEANDTIEQEMTDTKHKWKPSDITK